MVPKKYSIPCFHNVFIIIYESVYYLIVLRVLRDGAKLWGYTETSRKTPRPWMVHPVSESDLLELGFCLGGFVAVSVLLF